MGTDSLRAAPICVLRGFTPLLMVSIDLFGLETRFEFESLRTVASCVGRFEHLKVEPSVSFDFAFLCVAEL